LTPPVRSGILPGGGPPFGRLRAGLGSTVKVLSSGGTPCPLKRVLKNILSHRRGAENAEES